MRMDRITLKRLKAKYGLRIEFERYCSWKKKRIKNSWRRPTGIDNKLRLKLKSRGRWVEIGYKSRREIRGVHPSGYREVLVHNVKELEGLDPKVYAIRIAHTVGLKKREEIEKKAGEIGLHVLNPRKARGELE
ncbi:MAG: 50S ribosomal protein L32e [Candidatus Korarchaeota archaeon]